MWLRLYSEKIILFPKFISLHITSFGCEKASNSINTSKWCSLLSTSLVFMFLCNQFDSSINAHKWLLIVWISDYSSKFWGAILVICPVSRAEERSWKHATSFSWLKLEERSWKHATSFSWLKLLIGLLNKKRKLSCGTTILHICSNVFSF